MTMEMIELDRVSFEQSKALRKIGFPQDSGKLVYRYNVWGDMAISYDSNDWFNVAPYLESVNKWLRENKNLYCEPYRTAAGWACMIVKLPTGRNLRLLGRNGQFLSYERALSEGIDMVIRTLKNEEPDLC